MNITVTKLQQRDVQKDVLWYKPCFTFRKERHENERITLNMSSLV